MSWIRTHDPKKYMKKSDWLWHHFRSLVSCLKCFNLIGCPVAQSAARCSRCVCTWMVKCREHISLLIILCIIVYVTNKAHPNSSHHPNTVVESEKILPFHTLVVPYLKKKPQWPRELNGLQIKKTTSSIWQHTSLLVVLWAFAACVLSNWGSCYLNLQVFFLFCSALRSLGHRIILSCYSLSPNSI